MFFPQGVPIPVATETGSALVQLDDDLYTVKHFDRAGRVLSTVFYGIDSAQLVFKGAAVERENALLN